MVNARNAGVFSDDLYALVVLAAVLSIVLSGTSILFIDNLMALFDPLLKALDKQSKEELEREEKVSYKISSNAERSSNAEIS